MQTLHVMEKKEPYTPKRLNPKNDFLFKKLFAEEEGKPLLISLLNAIMRRDYLEFPKFRKIKFDIHDPLHRWMRFLEQNTTKEQIEELMKMDDTIRMAETRMTYLASDEETRLIYEQREKALHDGASLLKDAREEGMEKTATALNLLLKGRDVTEIMENTGLSMDEIKKIKVWAGIPS